MNKKGVELSMNLIIIAAIGLLVLVILAVLVIGSANKTNQGMQSCNLQGGMCVATCTGEQVPNSNGLCTSSTKSICCKVLPS